MTISEVYKARHRPVFLVGCVPRAYCAYCSKRGVHYDEGPSPVAWPCDAAAIITFVEPGYVWPPRPAETVRAGTDLSKEEPS